MHGISNSGIDFFNVDGMELTSQKINVEFTTKNIAKKFNQFKIKEKELTTTDSTLGFENFYVFKFTEEPKGIFNNFSYYFTESDDKKLIGITIGSVNKTDKELERQFVKLIKNNEIPKSIYDSLQIDSINFAGRKIPLGSSCRWMEINNVQCSYYGQMNWSVHKSFEDASLSVNNQYKVIKAKKGGKVVSDTTVTVVFEGAEAKAKKIVYDFTGVTSVLVGMSGGKTLTVYFVAAPVRNNFVSCVMSFWNNDQINPSGLTPLLEQVMKIK
ncbi:MAG: hypothetical protein ABIT08_07670 [Bacteroidia bacterium]